MWWQQNGGGTESVLLFKGDCFSVQGNKNIMFYQCPTDE